MSLCSVPPNSALVVSTSGSASVTVIVCVCSPGCNVRSTRTSPPVSSSTLSRSTALNPLNSARTLYVPGVRLGALNEPESSVVNARATPLCTSVTVTVAPEIAPPVWSVIAPRIRPALPWANEDRDISKRPALKIVTWIAFFKRHEDENFIGTPPLTHEALHTECRQTSILHFATPLPGRTLDVDIQLRFGTGRTYHC